MPRATAFRIHSSGQHRDEVQFAVAFKIVLVSRLWRSRFAERMSAVEQTDARWSALYMIADAPEGITQTRLAERLGMQLPTLVRHINGLVQQNLIERTRDPNDRRARIFSISTLGRQVLDEVDKQAALLRNQLFEGLSESDLEAAHRVLKHLSTQLELADRP